MSDLQERYDALLETAVSLAQLASYAVLTNGVTVNRDGIKKECDVIIAIHREKERQEMVKLNLEHPYSFRETPKSTEELYKWGMISLRQYEVVKCLPLQEAIEKCGGFQTWSFGVCHLEEYIAEREIDLLKDFKNVNDWAGHCIKLAKGRMNPVAPVTVWNNATAK